jgi:uncharacterized membrane protein HdeD (DUF308 family)
MSVVTDTVKSWTQAAKKNSGLLIALGVIEIIAGFLAVGSPLIAGLTITVFVGVMLAISGAARLLGAFKADSFGAGTLAFLGGVLALVVGLVMVARPGLGLTTLTLILTVYLFADGVSRVIVGFKVKPAPGWVWVIFGGIMSVLLGFFIGRDWPLSGDWAIGTLVGFQIIFAGWAAVRLGFGARSVADDVEDDANAVGDAG